MPTTAARSRRARAPRRGVPTRWAWSSISNGSLVLQRTGYRARLLPRAVVALRRGAPRQAPRGRLRLERVPVRDQDREADRVLARPLPAGAAAAVVEARHLDVDLVQIAPPIRPPVGIFVAAERRPQL